MSFVPIAIVGRGLVLPGALTPEAFWAAIREGRDLVTERPEGDWPDEPEAFRLRPGDPDAEDKTVTFRLGAVTGFESIFDASDFGLPAETILQLEPAFQWLLHSAREAVREIRRPNLRGVRSAVVVGNLSYPVRKSLDLAQGFWLDPILERLGVTPPPRPTVSPLNRFSSGLPAHMLARALGAEGPAFCLDAACASSLYALKYACDYLADGSVDVALATAVNACDSNFLHIGFTALRALSPTGMSRPFSQRADGLLPAKGAAAICLKRLADAERDGDRIFGVIRGVGLSNDGSRTILSPDSDGQIRAMTRAYRAAGVDPKSVSLVECHATGTPVGDKTELRSLKAVYDGVKDLPIGSLKSNLGHLITVAGLAGVVKVTSGFAAQIRPKSLNAEDPIAGFEGSGLRVLQDAEPWPETEQPRRAGLNNFGFGGNNAHVVLEEYRPARGFASAPRAAQRLPAEPVEIAICGLGVVAGETRGLEAFTRQLLVDEIDGASTRADFAQLQLRGLRFPPKELQDALGQHALIFEAAQSALRGVASVADERAGVFIGMGCDVDAARSGMRLRVKSSLKAAGISPSEPLVEKIKEAIGGARGAQIPLSSMPNLPANRINAQTGWKGVGFTVSGEELSGLVAVELAARALAQDELDLALAGAVDLSFEPVHLEAARQVLPQSRRAPGDAAIALVLKRRADAERCGDPIYATLVLSPSSDTHPAETIDIDDQPTRASERFGHAHAASGLVDLVAEIARIKARTCVSGTKRVPILAPAGQPAARFRRRSFTGQSHELTIVEAPAAPLQGSLPQAPCLFFSAADSFSDLSRRLARREPATEGSVRIAILATGPAQLAERIELASRMLAFGKRPAGPGVHFGDAVKAGDVAFVYSELGAAYSGAYRPLLDAFPEIVDRKMRHVEGCAREAFLAYADPDRPLDSALASAHIGAFHAFLATAVAREILGLAPQAALGLSMGESNMLAAMGAWEEPSGVMSALIRSGFYSDVAANYSAVAQSWKLAPGDAIDWQNWWVRAPIEDARAALDGLDRAYLLIVMSPESCVIGGDAAACAIYAQRIGLHRMVLTDSKAALHCSAAQPLAAAYRQAHLSKLRKIPGVRFYFNAVQGAVDLEENVVADLLARQAVECVDLRPTVLRAYADGVRVFVEIGPRAAISQSISDILGERRPLSLSLDQKGAKPLVALTRAAASLFAAGVKIDLRLLAERLATLRGDATAKPAQGDQKLRLPVHLQAVARGLAAVSIDDEDVRRTETASAPSSRQFAPEPATGAPPLSSVSQLLNEPSFTSSLRESRRNRLVPSSSPVPLLRPPSAILGSRKSQAKAP
ncbi:MAG: beta-ketoacyl synthase N-terminal-like domain-containing protein [Methylocystis sp.]|uniref:beta-ketoacyl synthase N-terminal-like domain-containing protein n=1 Tax=Methylocystis sp. TaxID=1911079 RepID=UPI003DA69E42